MNILATLFIAYFSWKWWNSIIVSLKYTTILIKSLFYILKQPRCLSSEFVLDYTISIYQVKMAFETSIIEVIFATITENLSAVTNDTHGYHTSQVLEYFTADGEPSWSLLPSSVSLLSGSIMHPENTYFCIPKVDI